MKQSITSRRRFLVASIAFSGLASGTLGPSVLRLSRAWAQSGANLDQGTLDAMVRVARLLYPHDAISDEVYSEVLNQALTATAADGSFAGVLRTAEDVLNAQQPADFVALGEEAQIAAMTAVEDVDFFAVIRGAVSQRLYYQPAIWALLGYEGPSYQQGGYLNRGAGEIDWLPEAE